MGSNRRVPVDSCARACELPSVQSFADTLNCECRVHLLWTEIAGRQQLLLGIIAGLVVLLAKIGNVQLRTSAHERIRIVKVVGGWQQIRMRPDGVTSGHASFGSQSLPDRRRLTQPPGPQFEPDQSRERSLSRPARGPAPPDGLG